MGAKYNPLNTLRAKIHIAKKALGLNDGEYRALLEANTGKDSSGTMTKEEMMLVLTDLTRLGWKPTSTPNPAPHTPPESRWLQRPSNWGLPSKNPSYRKLYALICANKQHGWNWGYVRGCAQKMFKARKSDEVVVLEWLTGQELHAVVQTLQIHANRLATKSPI